VDVLVEGNPFHCAKPGRGRESEVQQRIASGNVSVNVPCLKTDWVAMRTSSCDKLKLGSTHGVRNVGRRGGRLTLSSTTQIRRLQVRKTKRIDNQCVDSYQNRLNHIAECGWNHQIRQRNTGQNHASRVKIGIVLHHSQARGEGKEDQRLSCPRLRKWW